jgi:hypothetical protein
VADQAVRLIQLHLSSCFPISERLSNILIEGKRPQGIHIIRTLKTMTIYYFKAKANKKQPRSDKKSTE